MARGLAPIRRTHAKNYIHKEAQARLQEIIPTAQQQGMNALGVDYHEALLYIKQFSSKVCTCRETEVLMEEEYSPNSVVVKGTNSQLSDSEEISIDWGSPLFGDASEYTHEEDQMGSTDYDLEDQPSEFRENAVISTSAIDTDPDCGICYRTGFVPGYQLWNQTRVVLTTYDIVDESGFVINRSETPHSINKLTRNCYMDFVLNVPKYFVSATYSVRNNYEQTINAVYKTDNSLLTQEDLKANAGGQIVIRVTADKFTHIVFTFDLGGDPLKVNLAQMSKATDWTQFDAVSNLNIILPTTLREVTTGSIVVIPKLKLGLRITDVQFLRTASGAPLDWSCNTRVLQPMEPLKHIHKGIKVL